MIGHWDIGHALGIFSQLSTSTHGINDGKFFIATSIEFIYIFMQGNSCDVHVRRTTARNQAAVMPARNGLN